MLPVQMRPRTAIPPMAALAIALVVSGGIHVPVYVGLGILEKLLAAREIELAMAEPVELEFLEAEEPPAPTPEEPPPLPEEAEPEDPARNDAVDEPQATPPTPAAPEPEPEPEPVVAPPAPAATPPPPPPRENLRSVEHRSRDPNVEPPPDAQHLAEENSRVEEETQARIRNPNLNDENPQPASTPSTSESAEEGDASDTQEAQLADAEGSDARDPTPEEVRQPPRRPTRPSTSPTPSVAEAAQGDGRTGGADAPSRPREAAGGGARARGGGEPVETTTIVVDDGNGRFTVRVPVRPEGSGPGAEGGPAVAGNGRGREGSGRSGGAAGRGARTARGGAASGQGAPNLRLSWSDFASIYGEDELQRERDLALAQRQSRIQGRSRQRHWEQFRAAIENYDVRVRPGNQTALNTRADPFARYIAAMHRRIHQRFALSFLTHLPDGVDETFRGNSDMHTNLEIGIDGNGRVEHVSVIGTSGNTLFDLGAFEAVMGAQPFPEPPANIQSPDGLVYMHWAFFRNERQCGTFNARAYILATAPARRQVDRGPVDTLPPAVNEEE